MTKDTKAFKQLEKEWNIPKKVSKKGIITVLTKYGRFMIGNPRAIKNILLSMIFSIYHYWPDRAEYDYLNKEILLFDLHNLVDYCKRLIAVNSQDIYEFNQDRRLIHPLNSSDISIIIKTINKNGKIKKP